MKDKISIIVPVYNVEPYLEACAESLQKQTYKNIEVIFIDDCSKDNSYELCHQLKSKYKDMQIIVLKNDINRGLEYTRNRGLDVAAGDWIMFLDSDDTYDENAVEKMLSFALKYQCDLVFGEYKAVWKDREIVISSNMSSGLYMPKDFADHVLVDIPLEIISCVGTKIYNRKFLEENSLRFDRNYKFNEDFAFAQSTLNCAKRIGYYSFSYYNYQQRDGGSIQSSYRPAMFGSIIKARLLLKEFMKFHNSYTGIAKDLFVRYQFILAYDSLKNEARYANYTAFRAEFENIRKSEIYPEFLELKEIEGVRLSRLMLLCLKEKWTFILFVVLKIAVSVKSQTL